MIKNPIIIEDLEYIFRNLEKKEKFQGTSILITGCAGFLGYSILQFFSTYAKTLGIKRIIGLDNWIMGKPDWIIQLHKNTPELSLHTFNIANGNIKEIPEAADADFIIHMASIASPTFYRQYPIETMEANIWGLKQLLDFYMKKPIKGFLFFSSSEIYGDPTPDKIPTPEEYNGSVSCVGPRACYDESKRFGETLCYVYNNKHRIPITIVRPFNNYGPGMKSDDKRVPADFAKAVLENKDIVMYSDGTPTRTFCYVSDAILGYLKAMLYEKFDYFNIGTDNPEISIKQLAEIYIATGKSLFNYTGKLVQEVSGEKDYLKHNPNRRCPNITKAGKLLNFHPQISVKQGIERFLKHLALEKDQRHKSINTTKTEERSNLTHKT